MQAERLTPETPNGDLIVRTRFDKVVKQAEKICSPRNRSISNRKIDATMSFYGKQILATVYAVVKSTLIDLEAYNAIASR